MKISIDVDCAPEEARRFLGLPDLEPMQQAVMQEMQARLMASLKGMDPETLLQAWMPGGAGGFDQLQKYWTQFRAAADGKKGE